MRVPIRAGPVLGAGGLFGAIAVVVAQCTPPTVSTGADPGAPFAGAPVPAVTLAATTPLPPTAPVTTTAPTTTVPSPTSARVALPRLTVPAPATPAPTTAPAPATPDTVATTPAPAAQVAATAPPIVETAPPPPPPPVPATPPPTQPPPAVTDPPPPPPPPSPPPAQAVSAVVALVNQQRVAAGLAPLVEDGALTDAARAHAIDQAMRQEMTHTGSDGSSPGDRIARAGFAASTWAENVAAGYTSAAAVMDGWMGSPGHRDNILSPDFTAIGVASAQAGDGTMYWTMDLAA